MNLVVPKNDKENEYLCGWAAKIIGQERFERARAVGFANSTGLIAVVVLHDHTPPNVFLSWAATTPRWMSRGAIFAIYNWAYNQLKCTRITGLVEKNNKRARKVDEGLGMKLEGVLRKASPSGRDLMIYGLLKEEADELIKRLYANTYKKTAPVRGNTNAAGKTPDGTGNVSGRDTAATDGNAAAI